MRYETVKIHSASSLHVSPANIHSIRSDNKAATIARKRARAAKQDARK